MHKLDIHCSRWCIWRHVWLAKVGASLQQARC